MTFTPAKEVSMKIIDSRIRRTRYKIQIKTKRIVRRNKANIFLLFIFAIAAFALMQRKGH